MGAALLLCASGSYAQNWNPAPTAESTAYSSYPAAKRHKKIMQSLPNTPILKQILTVAIQ